MNSKELWETTMDPAHRILRLVTLDDAATADELFSVLMGEDVEARRSFIIRNAKRRPVPRHLRSVVRLPRSQVGRRTRSASSEHRADDDEARS